MLDRNRANHRQCLPSLLHEHDFEKDFPMQYMTSPLENFSHESIVLERFLRHITRAHSIWRRSWASYWYSNQNTQKGFNANAKKNTGVLLESAVLCSLITFELLLEPNRRPLGNTNITSLSWFYYWRLIWSLREWTDCIIKSPLISI